MANFGIFKHNKRSIAPLFFRFLLISTITWIILLFITLMITLRLSLTTMQEKIEKDLLATSTTLASSNIIKQMFADGYCSPDDMEYLDNFVKNNSDLDVISIADKNSIRLYHVNHSQIGKKFVGGDEETVLLTGEKYLSEGKGTMGWQRRAFAPIRDSNGYIIGFVMSSTKLDTLGLLRSRIKGAYSNLAIVMFLGSLLVAFLLSIFIKRQLLGNSPEELVHAYLVQSTILNKLNDGIISLNATGHIQLVNAAANKMLGQRSDLLEGKPLDNFLLDSKGTSLLNNKQTSATTSNPNILCTTIPLEDTAQNRTGTTIILTDKSEAQHLANQLNGTQHIISMLRANRHEFMNKLHVISGMLQMGKQADALRYISGLAEKQTTTIGPVLQYIHNANVAALILGKLSNMNEFKIHFTLLPNSYLPEHSLFLSTSELITIIGNLLENALEAINLSSGNELRNIVMQITENPQGLLLTVSDTGIGIDPNVLPHIYETGFSTKAETGRGFGMSLIHSIAEKHNATIDVDSEPKAGTFFSLYFSQKRYNSEVDK